MNLSCAFTSAWPVISSLRYSLPDIKFLNSSFHCKNMGINLNYYKCILFLFFPLPVQNNDCMHQAHSIFVFCLMLHCTVFLNLLFGHFSAVQSLPASLKNTALQADDHLASGRCLQTSQAPLVLGFLLPYWSDLSHSCLLIMAIDVTLPADSRQPLDTFNFKSKQCLGYKEQSWEY